MLKTPTKRSALAWVLSNKSLLDFSLEPSDPELLLTRLMLSSQGHFTIRYAKYPLCGHFLAGWQVASWEPKLPGWLASSQLVPVVFLPVDLEMTLDDLKGHPVFSSQSLEHLHNRYVWGAPDYRFNYH